MPHSSKPKPEKWFSVLSDFHGRDGYPLGSYNLSPYGFAAYILGIAWTSKYQWKTVGRYAAGMFVGERRAKRATDELVSRGFWLPTDAPDAYTIAHEGVLWRRGRVARPPLSAAIRARVYIRDGYACAKCGRDQFLTIDHIHPWVLGGSDDLENLRVLCRSCNSRKGARIDAA